EAAVTHIEHPRQRKLRTMDAACVIELFGGLRVRQGDRTITRFRTHKTAALLAFLAFYRERPHSREALIEMHWPDDELEAGRGKLRLALSSLRAQLQPPGGPAAAVVPADRRPAQLNPRFMATDGGQFEA